MTINKYKIIYSILVMFAEFFWVFGMFRVNEILGWASIFTILAWWIHYKIEELKRDELRFMHIKELPEILKKERENSN